MCNSTSEPQDNKQCVTTSFYHIDIWDTRYLTLEILYTWQMCMLIAKDTIIYQCYYNDND